jgi:O-antigen/teichoic acid export membrane protein
MMRNFLYVLSHLLGPILAFISIPIVSKAISPADYGNYNYFVTLAQIVLMLNFMPSINSSILRFGAQGFQYFDEDISYILKILFISTFTSIFFIFILGVFLKNYIFVFVAISVLQINIIISFKNYLNVNMERYKHTLLTLGVILSQYGYIYYQYLIKNLSMVDLIFGNFVFSICIIAYIFVKNYDFVRRVVFSRKIKSERVFKFIVPSFFIGFNGLVINATDRLMIKGLIDNGEIDLGVYVMHQNLFRQPVDALIGVLFLFIPSSLYVLYEKYGDKRYISSLRQLISWVLILAIITISFCHYVYDDITKLLLAQAYLSDTNIGIPMLYGHFSYLLYLLCANYFTVSNNKRIPLFVLIFGAVLNIILNFIFIPIMGMEGAIISTILTNLSIFIGIQAMVYHISGEYLLNIKHNVIWLFPIYFIVGR